MVNRITVSLNSKCEEILKNISLNTGLKNSQIIQLLLINSKEILNDIKFISKEKE